MKKHSLLYLALISLASVAFSSCSSNSKVELPYSTGIGDNGAYNTDRFFYNGVKYSGADPGGIYVPKERSKEYGGYTYIYVTGDSSDTIAGLNSEVIANTYGPYSHVSGLAIMCFRTKDFASWEAAGSEINGYSLIMYEDDFIDWHAHRMWAPEVIYDAETAKYYMYLTSACRIYKEGSIKYNEDSTISERMSIVTAISDTPVGPFKIINNEETLVNGRKQSIPFINFQKAFNLPEQIGVIDVSPFVDDDGTLYLYFKVESGRAALNLYCMKMKSFVEPDYDSLTAVAAVKKETITSPKGKDSLDPTKIVTGETFEDGYLLEAPFVTKHQGHYYLTYSVNGYTDPAYSVYQAVSDKPDEGFKKVALDIANPVLSGMGQEYSRGTGHHCFVNVEGINYVIYHAHANAASASSAWGYRVLMADAFNYYDVGLDYDVIMCNAPSKSLTAIPEQLGGYKNYAYEADISVNKGEGVNYLTDGLLPYYSYNEDRFFKVDGNLTITMSFDEPKTINTVMVHNSSSAFTAFSKIDYILFELAEKPAFLDKEYGYALIKDLEFPSYYLKDGDANYIVYCAPAVAVFEDIKVKSVQIIIKEESRLLKENKLGEKNKTLELAEIVVLGRENNE